MDPRLHPFLETASTDGAGVELVRLMELAAPLIAGVVRHRVRPATSPDAADAASEARLRVLTCLHRLRSTHGDSAGQALPPIADFTAYVCTVADCACADLMRRRNPERAKLVNRLRYLLEKRTTQHGFALWLGDGGEAWAGFADWRDDLPDTFSSARQLQLLMEPGITAAEVFGANGWTSLPLPDLIAGLFSWVGGPLKLSDFTDAVTRLQTGPVALVRLDSEDENEAAGYELPDFQPSPSESLRWKEYLTWLWQQATRLNPPQRNAFFLHSPCLHEMEFEGLTSVRQAAAILGMAAERMAELWNSLPLDDLAIGALLEADRQQVINWRKSARTQLGREWRRWLNIE